ncbi:microbial collagenase [Agromyces hippuratus]|uniref:microbial collagenase n=1 Tax=Agromyces hippuratus TaxID=286438 RepID=A0A852X7A0_9MICO|nr:collagenase [Agromyces hippuratus]NYG21841.1 microbial collagenase [Agromyces hippuratus]
MTQPIRRRGTGTAIALSLVLAFSLGAPLGANAAAPPDPVPSGSGPAADTGGVAATGSSDALVPEADPEPAAPLTANAEVHRTEAGDVVAVPDRPSAGTTGDSGAPSARQAAAAAECSTADFAAASGQSLVDLIVASPMDCINSLFLVKGADARSIFAEAQMITVANALRTVAGSYPGDNSTSAGQLVLFLRAGYYVQFYDAGNVGDYGLSLSNAAAGALDAFFGNPRSRDVTDANGEVLGEAVTLIDSAVLNDRYLDVVERLLTEYDAEYEALWWMRNAVNNVFTVLFRGHQVPEFVAAVAADPSLLTTLHDFAVAHLDRLGGDSAFLPTNAGRELARFLGDDSVRAAAKPLVADLLTRTSLDGPTAQLWVALGQMANYYDPEACADYGTCDLGERVADAVLVTEHDCSSSITIRAQEISAEQLAASCSSLLAQDQYFHAVANDPGPVPNDVNSTIEVVVFDSSSDYQSYAGAIFGIDTNNGGMYLEGDPSAADNVARFIAYEAEWLRPAFAVWNLNHEYTHYLDGRFNMHGDFEEGMQTPTIWWVEGFAEFISYHYRGEDYTAAQAAAAQGTYALSQLFDTNYDHGQERVYRWGYLAAAFMLNERPSELQAILGSYRAGDWDAARTYITDTIGTRYDAEFAAYLERCAAGDCSDDLGGGGTDPVNRVPVASFGISVDGLEVGFTDTSTDDDGTIASRRWQFGDGQESTEANPTIAFAAAGTYSVTLTVTDDDGAIGTATLPVTVADDGAPALPECTGSDLRQLDDECRRSGRSAARGDTDGLFIWIPAGTAQVTVTTTGGTGDADLYYNCYGWAGANAHVARSTTPGSNEESVVVAWPAAGWNYVGLTGVEDFAGVTVTASY